MFLLRAKNTYGQNSGKKQPVYQVKRYSCLYIASVELFIELGEDVSAMKKTVNRTVNNLNLKSLTGDPVQIVLNESGIIIQENKYKDSQANDVLMAHALKRICYTTSYPRKRIYVFVSRLPQEERVFSHFFLMQDKSSGDKIIKELSNAFTNAFKAKKRKTLEKDNRRNLRAQHPVAPAPAPIQAPKAPVSPKKKKNKPPIESQFAPPPPPYVDVLYRQDDIFQEFDVISPLNTPSAPPLFSEPAHNNHSAGASPFSTDYTFSPQPLQHNRSPQHAPPLYLNDPFIPQQAEPPRYIQDPFAPQQENFTPINIQQDPFSQLQIFPQSPNHNPSSVHDPDALPSYNSYNKEFQMDCQVSKDDLLIDLTSPDHIPTSGRLIRSLSTSNVLEEVRSESPPFLPPAYRAPEPALPPTLPSNHLVTPVSPSRSHLGAARPKSGMYPSLSQGLERESFLEPFDANDVQHQGFSYHDEHYELANEPWYQEGLPRDIIIELLKSQKEGAFFIRESLSQPGKLALSVRGSSSVIHFLIDKSRKGYCVENDKIFFPTISLLVMHHSIHKGPLPCTLTVGDSNPAYLRADHLESSDSEAEGEDPIYTTYALTGSMNVQQH